MKYSGGIYVLNYRFNEVIPLPSKTKILIIFI
jgi:hypothetical protein